MSDFKGRLDLAGKLERSFIDSFNSNADGGFQIIKYGIESTELAKSHQYVNHCYDDTSRFIRYIPDSVLLHTNSQGDCPTSLIEFKAANTGLYSDRFFGQIKASCPGISQPFDAKENVFNIENDALNLYRKLCDINVQVIVVGYAGWYDDANCLKAQYVQQIADCGVYNPGTGKGGSGTHIANVNFESFANIDDFFPAHFGISDSTMRQVIADVRERFVSPSEIKHMEKIMTTPAKDIAELSDLVDDESVDFGEPEDDWSK